MNVVLNLDLAVKNRSGLREKISNQFDFIFLNYYLGGLINWFAGDTWMFIRYFRWKWIDKLDNLGENELIVLFL